MPKSSLTVEQLKAQAMLMGKLYDAKDHTFYRYHMPGEDMGLLDADTLEPISAFDYYDVSYDRHDRVRAGDLGAADYNPLPPEVTP